MSEQSDEDLSARRRPHDWQVMAARGAARMREKLGEPVAPDIRWLADYPLEKAIKTKASP